MIIILVIIEAFVCLM